MNFSMVFFKKRYGLPFNILRKWRSHAQLTTTTICVDAAGRGLTIRKRRALGDLFDGPCPD